MKYRYRVSFIVPIYNVEQYLERCIKSLLNQDLDHSVYEIILIDDGSTDSSHQIAERYSKAFENIHLYTQNNQGLSVARNTGMDHIQGKYTIFVDSDDGWKENKLAALYRTAEENDLDICFFLSVINEPNGSYVGCKQPFEYNKIYNGEFLLLNNLKVASIWDKIYKTDFILKYRFYPNISHQDVEFNYKTYPFAKKIMFTNNIIYDYTWNDNSISRSQKSEKKLKRAKDDIIIASNLMAYSDEFNFSENLRILYKSRAASITFAQLCEPFMKKSNITITYMDELLNFAKEKGVYPVRYRTCSKKSSIILPFLNCESLYRLILRLTLNSESSKSL